MNDNYLFEIIKIIIQYQYNFKLQKSFCNILIIDNCKAGLIEFKFSIKLDIIQQLIFNYCSARLPTGNG